MEKVKKILITSLVIIVMVGISMAAVLRLCDKFSDDNEQKEPDLRESDDIIFARKLGNGINIGNSLDSTGMKEWHSDAKDLDYETYWKNVPICEELFVMIKKAGIAAVRIPVSWDEHIDSDGKISDIWMNRVKEVVDMALKHDLYVILDTHHENWLSLEPDKKEQITGKYINVWGQICLVFEDYDEHLIYEGMNEPRKQDSNIEWTEGNEELRGMVNELNEAFYNTVRNSGGNNKGRYVMISTYCNSVKKEAISELKIPGDKVMVSVHGYKPYNFCFADEKAKKWNDEDSGTGDSKEKIKEFMGDLYDAFISKGIPVVITEYAASTDRDERERLEWLHYYLSKAKEYDIQCMWWDDGNRYKLMDRVNYEWYYLDIIDKFCSNN